VLGILIANSIRNKINIKPKLISMAALEIGKKKQNMQKKNIMALFSRSIVDVLFNNFIPFCFKNRIIL